MPKTWRLTRAAERSLIEIAMWTVETFGPRQAAAYEEDLIVVCRGIAAGTVQSQDCRRIIDPDLSEDLRFARAGGVAGRAAPTSMSHLSGSHGHRHPAPSGATGRRKR